MRLARRTVLAVGLIGLAGFVWAASIWTRYQASLPRFPAPFAGRIYPLNISGFVVYMTGTEQRRLQEIEYTSASLFVSALIVGIALEAGSARWTKAITSRGQHADDI